MKSAVNKVILVKGTPQDEGWYALMRDNQERNFLRIEIRCADLPPLRS